MEPIEIEATADFDVPAHYRFQIERGSQKELRDWVVKRSPAAERHYLATEHIHHSMPPWESTFLAMVGQWFNYGGARILEIGGAKGGSAAIWAESAPHAYIRTLEPAKRFREELEANLAPYKNVEIFQQFSWHHFEQTRDSLLDWDLVFVDGNHVLVHRDLVWWNRLRPGGLMLFDDYTPRIYPVVCAAVRDLWEYFGHSRPDILLKRVGRGGIAGLWKRSSEEVWPETHMI